MGKLTKRTYGMCGKTLIKEKGSSVHTLIIIIIIHVLTYLIN